MIVGLNLDAFRADAVTAEDKDASEREAVAVAADPSNTIATTSIAATPIFTTKSKTKVTTTTTTPYRTKTPAPVHVASPTLEAGIVVTSPSFRVVVRREGKDRRKSVFPLVLCLFFVFRFFV